MPRFLFTGTLVLAALLCGSAGYGSARASELPEGEEEAPRGSLSREVIRRVIRRHMREIRQCYEEGLSRDATLAGRVTVRFIVGPDGAVKASHVQETTLGDRRVERCIATAVRSWRFPAPDGGGIVIVNYPFVLNPA